MAKPVPSCDWTRSHIWHAIERNSSIRELADLPPGHMASRIGAGQPWLIEPFDWEDEA